MKIWRRGFEKLVSKILAEMKIWWKVLENLMSKILAEILLPSFILAEMKIWRKCLARACLPDPRWEILSQLVAQTPNTDSPGSANSHYHCHHCHHLSILTLSVSSLSSYQQTHTITIVIIWSSLVAQLMYHLYFNIQGTDKYCIEMCYLSPGHLCHLLLLLKVEKAKEVGDPRVGRDVRLAAEFPVSKRWLKITINFLLGWMNVRCTNLIKYV